MAIAWEYVAASWATLEGSREAGGLPLVYLLKSLIMVLPALLLIQSFSAVTDCISTLVFDKSGESDLLEVSDHS
jgi:TRAP-type mannitol/chloroaromatic compound transport system permease small subunit